MTDFRCNRPPLDRVLARADSWIGSTDATGANAAHAARVELAIGWYEASSRCIACRDERKEEDLQPGCGASSRPRLPSA